MGAARRSGENTTRPKSRIGRHTQHDDVNIMLFWLAASRIPGGGYFAYPDRARTHPVERPPGRSAAAATRKA